MPLQPTQPHLYDIQDIPYEKWNNQGPDSLHLTKAEAHNG